jgi:hypothetical protein
MLADFATKWSSGCSELKVSPESIDRSSRIVIGYSNKLKWLGPLNRISGGHRLVSRLIGIVVGLVEVVRSGEGVEIKIDVPTVVVATMVLMTSLITSSGTWSASSTITGCAYGVISIHTNPRASSGSIIRIIPDNLSLVSKARRCFSSIVTKRSTFSTIAVAR